MTFETIEQGIANLRAQAYRECRVQELDRYIPLFGKSSMSEDAETNDLEESIRNFLTSDNPKQVCALFGNGGSGKSLFLKNLTVKLWDEYLPEKSKSIPLFISLPTLIDPIHYMVQEKLRKCGFNDAQIIELKTHYSFIFLLDGYDELHRLQNLYVSNHLESWSAKSVITCRTQYFYNKSNPAFCFVPSQNSFEQSHLLQMLYISPFNPKQIETYLDSAHGYNNTIPTYTEIKEIPGLQDLITNPLLLYFTTRALPQILVRFTKTSQDTEEQRHVTKTELYKEFLNSWFVRQEIKLKEGGHIPQDKDPKPIFRRYCESLAVEMHKHNLSLLKIDDPRFAIFFENDPETEILYSACPIVKTNSMLSFWHESLGTHFTNQKIYEERQAIDATFSSINLNADINTVTFEPVDLESSSQEVIHMRLFTDEFEALSGLAEEIRKDKYFEDYLFQIIHASRSQPNGHIYAIGAANAISALNVAGVNFSGMNLSNIRIPYANLNGAALADTNLSGSDLTGVTFHNAMLFNANMSNAILDNTNFLPCSALSLADKEISHIATCPYDSDLIAYAQKEENFFSSRDVSCDIYIIRLSKGQIEKRLQGHTEKIIGLAWSMNGILASSDSETIRIWDPSLYDKHCIGVIENPDSSKIFTNLMWSPDGKMLAAASGDLHEYIIYVWDMHNPQNARGIATLKGHADMISSFAWSHDGFLASGSWDGTVRIWDIHKPMDEACIRILGTPTKTTAGRVRGLHQQLMKLLGEDEHEPKRDKATLTRDMISLIETTNSLEPKIDLNFMTEGRNLKISAIAWFPSQYLAYAADKIYVWDINSPPEKGCVASFVYDSIRDLNALSWSRDGYLASAGADKIIRIWDLYYSTENTCLKQFIGHTDSITCLTWVNSNTDHQEQLISGSEDTTLRVWDMGYSISNVFSTSPVLKDHFRNFIWTSDGLRLAAGRNDGSIRIWDFRNQTEELQVYDIKESNDFHMPITCLSWSPEGYLAYSNKESTIFVLDPNVPKHPNLMNSFPGHKGGTSCLAWSPDGKLLASGGRENIIYIWDCELIGEDACIACYKEHAGPITAVLWSKDSKLLFSASVDGTVRIWDVLNNRCKNVLQNPVSSYKNDTKERKEILSLAYSARGYIACIVESEIKQDSSEREKIILIWDVRKVSAARNIAKIKMQDDWYPNVSWSTDGLWLLSSSEKEIWFWRFSEWSSPKYKLSLGAQYACLYNNKLAVSVNTSVHALEIDFDNFQKRQWIFSQNWDLNLKNCNMAGIPLSGTSRRVFTKAGAVFDAPQSTSIQLNPSQLTKLVKWLKPHELSISTIVGFFDYATLVRLDRKAFRAMSNGDYQEAISLFEELMTLIPNMACNYHNCACACHMLAIKSEDSNFFAKADSLFQNAIKLAPESVDLLVEYANFLRERKQLTEALAVLDKAISLSTDKPGGLEYREGELLSLPQELAKEFDMQKRIDIKHPKIFAYYLQINCLNQLEYQERIRPVLNDLQVLVDSLAQDKSAWFNYKLLYYSYRCSGKIKDAERTLEKSNQLRRQYQVNCLLEIVDEKIECINKENYDDVPNEVRHYDERYISFLIRKASFILISDSKELGVEYEACSQALKTVSLKQEKIKCRVLLSLNQSLLFSKLEDSFQHMANNSIQLQHKNFFYFEEKLVNQGITFTASNNCPFFRVSKIIKSTSKITRELNDAYKNQVVFSCIAKESIFGNSFNVKATLEDGLVYIFSVKKGEAGQNVKGKEEHESFHVVIESDMKVLPLLTINYLFEMAKKIGELIEKQFKQDCIIVADEMRNYLTRALVIYKLKNCSQPELTAILNNLEYEHSMLKNFIDQLLLISEDPITHLLHLAVSIEEREIDDTDQRKLYNAFITAINSSEKRKEIVNSPQIFKFGLKICQQFSLDYKELLNNNSNFPPKISKIIIGIHEKKKFIFNCKKEDWIEFNLYVSRDVSGFFQTYNGRNERGSQARIILKQVENSEFFKMSVKQWPTYFMYVSNSLDGTVRDDHKGDPGPQGYFSLTPYQDGDYFTITTQKWPDARLYVSNDMFGIVRGQRIDAGEQAYIGITPHE